ncbi:MULTISPECIES: flagellar hook-basal body complex protein FliE [unclassified Cupriavidus]|jgi:flagellar hook-basal body complex protein FliE|uniref:flagellar hook-basal body complex protein FliE n=1 Tax=unclassified Cupriavidus TaxID=2640874 RepID=UPI001C008824|nr:MULTISPECIES: flagellar hook-basal body complex protein FliE [unclassified Cupriavidus]MCA3182050.1 flagellar hook-basal body complex protein FliE [Cupriavidus sp.]MCA3192482.1 flagellar hook-basal body complex protein FliE [Cupriavidus sp.]MCA3198906.1 flagellar hook-basal body complex protein FliE [Cupriavidus sp.]MCA3205268.1 flagellar hook-basal body complex protein FliE [Cupriavidus sp.]MCA3207298.1 flagellar hook-basal body complex protein FliE [Cupriavidus sp.]
MTISSIEGMLQQLRGLAQVAGGGTTAPANAAATAGFAGELQRSLQRLNATQEHAYGQAEAFEVGKPGVSLNDVMIDMQKANISFQTTVQVRNRLAAAYQEMMNMPV